MSVKLGDAILYFGGNTDRLDQTMQNTQGRVNSWGQGVAGFFSNAFSYVTGNLITSGIQRVTTAIRNLAGGMVSGNAEFEDYNMRFQVLLRNAQLAQERLKQLAQFGATTPFDLPGVVKADVILQAFGFHAADAVKRFGLTGEEIRRVVGDVASGTGRMFEEIATYVGRFASGDTAEAIMRFAEMGVVTREQLKALGMEFDANNKLLTDLDTATGILLQAMQEKYGGLMEAQSNTLLGMLSNLRDWAGNTIRILGQPVFDRARAGLKELVDFLSSDAVTSAIEGFGQVIGDSIAVVETLIALLLGGNLFGGLDSFMSSLNEKLESAHQFLVQLKDELQGLSGADILAELGPGLAELNAQMKASLDDLEQAYNDKVDSLTAQLAAAHDKFNATLAEIDEKYAPKLKETAERFDKSIARIQLRLDRLISDAAEASIERNRQRNERLTEMEDAYQKRRSELQEQLRESISRSEDRLTELKQEHIRKRAGLVMDLMLAESEEEYLRIQQQLKAEDTRYAEEERKAKSAADRQAADLRARLKEEQAEYDKAVKKFEANQDRAVNKAEKTYQRQLHDLRASLDEQKKERQKALDEIEAEKKKEVDEATEALDEKTRKLETALEQERRLYRENQDAITDAFKSQMAALEAEVNRRAAAVGSGPAAEVATYLRDLVTQIQELRAATAAFLNEHGDKLLAVLIGIGAVLVGGGVISALTALVGLITAISWPVVALVAAVAGLYLAWTENWGGIQEKTQAVIDWLQPYLAGAWQFLSDLTSGALEKWRAWWAEHGEAVMTIVNFFVGVVTSVISAFIGNITLAIQIGLSVWRAFWQEHGDWLTIMFSLLWDSIKVIVETVLIIITELIEAFAALLSGDMESFKQHIGNIWYALWDGVRQVTENFTQMILATVGEFIESVVGFFTDTDWMKLGEDMWNGIKEGIKKAKDAVTSTIRDAVDSLIDNAADALEAKSPSAKAARRVGEPIGLGIEQGFMAQMIRLRQMMAAQMAGLVGSLSPAAGLMGVGAGGGLVQFSQTNYVGGGQTQVDQEVMLDQLKEQTMDLMKEHYEE